jgi:hypothetical protein
VPGGGVTGDGSVSAPGLTGSERDWLRVRRYLQEHRYELAADAAGGYRDRMTLAGTPLLTAGRWLPHAPIPLAGIGLEFCQQPALPRVTGSAEPARQALPRRGDGSRYRRYSEAMGTLAAPRVFEDRPTYRLVEADLAGPHGRLVFGRGSYFDGIDTGEASAHEYAARRLGAGPVSPLTVRHDRRLDRAAMLLHWRDPAKVGHAGGLYQVIPVGVFQPSGYAPWNERNDFGLWRCMLREFAEELGGEDEDHGSERAPIDYDGWPFGARLTGALDSGQVRAYCLGLGTDPLTFATDLLTVAVFDAPVFDEVFAGLPAVNAEGRLLSAGGWRPTGTGPRGGPSGLPFTAEAVDRFAFHEPVQAAGAALLALAWQHRRRLLS